MVTFREFRGSTGFHTVIRDVVDRTKAWLNQLRRTDVANDTPMSGEEISRRRSRRESQPYSFDAVALVSALITGMSLRLLEQ